MTPARRRMLGATDAGPVLAYYRPELAPVLAKYKTAADVWLRIVHDVDQPSNARMQRGLTVEPVLRQLYRETIGEASEAPGVVLHPSMPFACASPDGYEGDDIVVEYKTTSAFSRHQWGDPASDKFPAHYQTQTQWLLEVTGREMAIVLVAFGTDGKDERGEPHFGITETCVFQTRRDEELGASIADAFKRFWAEHCEPRIAPLVLPAHNKRRFKELKDERRPDEYLRRLGQAG